MSQQPVMYRIPHDSNLRYLPFVFFLPEELIAKCPTLRALPRCLGEINRSEKLIDSINSNVFLKEIMDAAAALAFPYFGFGGWKEHYTGHCPVWQLTYALPLWTRLLEDETGWGLQRLFLIPSTDIIPFFDPDFIKEVMERIVKRGIVEENWQPILDAVKKMPCDEDFERYNTNVRIDFYRKWYHTRSKRIKLVSLEETMAGEDGDYVTVVAADPRDMTEIVAAEDYCIRFKSRLSNKDREILELREDGFTFEEIADKLGYKNHSGVVKRMQAIKEVFLKYENEQR